MGAIDSFRHRGLAVGAFGFGLLLARRKRSGPISPSIVSRNAGQHTAPDELA